MGDITDINDRAHAKATEASVKGKFNLLDRLASRNYPTEEVAVYLDEAAGYQLAKIEREREALRVQLKLAGTDKGRIAELNKQFKKLDEEDEAVREVAADSRVVFHLQGISSREYDLTVDAAKESFPYEYREVRNPITMALTREIIEEEDREIFFRTLLWSKFIKRVVDASGNEDDNITHAWMSEVDGLIPVMGAQRISDAITLLRMTTGWMDEIQGEDFLAKS